MKVDIDFEKVYQNGIGRRIYSYRQCNYYVMSGVRGCGKTFITQSEILNAVHKGGFFVYIRETKPELQNALRSGFWDSGIISKPEYNQDDYQCISNRIIINNKVVGIAFSLSTVGVSRGAVMNVGGTEHKPSATDIENAKREIKEVSDVIQNNLEKLKDIFFDEFIPVQSRFKPETRLELFIHTLESICRMRPGCRVHLNGNLQKTTDIILQDYLNFGAEDLMNPDGLHKSYTLPDDRNNPIEPLAVWVHMTPNKEWLKARDHSVVGKALRGKQSDMFGTGKAYVNAEIPLIRGKPLPRFIMFNLSNGINQITFWKTRFNVFYVTARTNNATFPTYVFDNKLCNEKCKLVTDVIRKVLQRLFEENLIEYDCAKSYETFIDIMPTKKEIKTDGR